jgi:Flp pilus assembly protein TadB
VPGSALLARPLRRWRAARERRALATALPDVARALSRALAAGLPFDAAYARAADALPDEAAAVLREAARRARGGAPPAEALGALAAVEGGALVVGAVALAADLGGDVVRALAALGDGLAERERLRTEVAVATAQAAFTARIVPLVPFAAAAALWLTAPDAAAGLVASPAGEVLLAISAGMTALALWLLRRIARGALP